MTPALITRNTLAGITTSLAMVPEVVAFALLAQVNPLVGLYAAVILGLVTSIFGGRPGLISGGAGSLAVVSVALVVSHGVEYLFACIILMGIIQFVFGALKLGKLIKLVSPSVMTGFVNGLALVIFLAQLEQLKSNGLWLQSYELISMLGLIAITIFGVYISPKITRHIPASLFGIVLVTVFVMIFGIDAKTVGDIAYISGNLPTLHIPNIPWTLETLWIVAPYSFILAAVGLIETLLTANLVDDFVQNHKTQPNKESIAQGVGNILTGLFGGMGGCAMIGQTVINLKAGGTHRLAGVVEALSILAYIVFASAVIESIPIAALVGVMCMVCYYTFDWTSFKIIGKPKQDVAIIVIVTTVTVLLNLAYAVILGIILTYIFQKFKKESL